LWLLGIGLELCSTFVGTVGKQLIRRSQQIIEAEGLDTEMLSKEEEEEGGGASSGKSACYFRIAMVLNTVMSPAFEMSAYAFAPQSTIAPFGGLDTVWNALLAPCTLKETMTFKRGLGAAIIMTGTIASAFFSNTTDIKYTVADLEALALRWRVFWYVVGFTIWFLLHSVNVWGLGHKPGSVLRGLSLGMMAGTLAGNMFCVKLTMELVKISIADGAAGVWDHWLPYCTLVCAAIIAISNVILLTKGMQENQALFMVSVFEGSMIVANAASGCIVLGDMDNAEPYNAVCFTLCIIVVVVGLLVLISGEEDSTPASTDFADFKDEEEGGGTDNPPPQLRDSDAGGEEHSRAESAPELALAGGADLRSSYDRRPKFNNGQDSWGRQSGQLRTSLQLVRSRSASSVGVKPWTQLWGGGGVSRESSRETTPVGSRDSIDPAVNPPRDAADMISMMARSDSMKESNKASTSTSTSLDEGSIAIDMKPTVYPDK